MNKTVVYTIFSGNFGTHIYNGKIINKSVMKLVYKRFIFWGDNDSYCLTEYWAGLFGRSPTSRPPPQPGPSCLSTISDWFLTLSKTACQVLSVEWSNETKLHLNFIPLILIYKTLFCRSVNTYKFLVGFDPG